MTPRLKGGLTTLNRIARQELGQHRHRYNRLGCKPHPHELGPFLQFATANMLKGG